MNEAAIKERPILFSAAMVRAILDGRKTQTRRVVKPRKDLSFGCLLQPNELAGEVNNGSYLNCVYGKPGDKFWLRETWSQHPQFADIAYKADGEEFEDSDGFTWIPKWKPSIHMPRWASRINLEITGLRVECLQNINRQDSFAEGIQNLSDGDYYEFGIRDLCSAQHPVRAYQLLWESINGQGSWDKNPWVWVIEFKRIDESVSSC
jgi:hypothetical protein